MTYKLTCTFAEGSVHSPVYENWLSIVASGLPAGTFAKITETPNTYYVHTPATANTREYYYIVAKSGGMESGKSAVRWVEVG